MKADAIYQTVADALIASIQDGIANPDGWSKPWRSMVVGHKNATTGKYYQGFNQLLLMVLGDERGYTPMWATFKQWEALGARVKKGEKATHLIKWVAKKCETGHPSDVICSNCGKGFPVGFAVFNSEQVDGYTYTPTVVAEHERLAAAEALVEAARVDGLNFREVADSDRAFYDRSVDRVVVPNIAQFATREGYYATVLHELSHATCHASRCDRDFGAKRFGDDAYAMEELCAEFASAFLCAATGIVDGPGLQHGNYLANWLRVLKNDPKALSHASSKAQTAASYWLDKTDVLPKVAPVEVEAAA